MQVPEPWQRNWVSASHTVVANTARKERRRRKEEVKVVVGKQLLLSKCVYSMHGSEVRGTASYKLCSMLLLSLNPSFFPWCTVPNPASSPKLWNICPSCMHWQSLILLKIRPPSLMCELDLLAQQEAHVCMTQTESHFLSALFSLSLAVPSIRLRRQLLQGQTHTLP